MPCLQQISLPSFDAHHHHHHHHHHDHEYHHREGMTDPTLTSPSPNLLFGKSAVHWLLLIICSLANVIGGSAATLLGRLYFVRGGSRRWLYAWNQSVAWPILLLPLLLLYWRQSKHRPSISLKLLVIYAVMGSITAIDNLLYAWGLSYLPVSTSSLLCSSQLAFNVAFAFLLTRHKITPCILNSVVLITIGAALLGLHANTDRPAATTRKEYMVGFIMTVVASGLYALIMVLMEVIYRRVVGGSHFLLVVESQACISAVATAFSMVGMWVAGDFTAMREEARGFELGSSAYTLTLIWSAVGWQLFFLGSSGIIFLTSSLMSCVFMTATLPVVPILGTIFFHDSFSSLKIISTLLSIWGFVSYVYGGFLAAKSPLNST